MNRIHNRIIALLAALVFLCGGCGEKTDSRDVETAEHEAPAEIWDDTPKVLKTEALGTQVLESETVSLDSSNENQGYIMVKYTGAADKVRMLVTGPDQVEYNYLLSQGKEYEAFPLTAGSGTYHIGIYENIEGNRYAMVFSEELTPDIQDEIKVYLFPNQYISFTEDSQAISVGQELAKGAAAELQVVERVYHFVTENISYDSQKAQTVTAGYLPSVDETLTTKKGICFDYAALMAAMLRSQGIPTRLEIGYAKELYHAWISVYVPQEGWIDNIIAFDGKEWRLMDPTLAAGAKKSTVKEYMEKADTYYILKYKY